MSPRRKAVISSLLPSELGRLVLGYLEENGCTKATQFLLQELPALSECAELRKRGRQITTRIGNKTLEDMLQDYMNTRENVTDRIKHHPVSFEGVPKSGNLCEQVAAMSSLLVKLKLAQKQVNTRGHISKINLNQMIRTKHQQKQLHHSTNKSTTLEVSTTSAESLPGSHRRHGQHREVLADHDGFSPTASTSLATPPSSQHTSPESAANQHEMNPASLSSQEFCNTPQRRKGRAKRRNQGTDQAASNHSPVADAEASIMKILNNLYENTALHEKIAANINRGLGSQNKNELPSDSKPEAATQIESTSDRRTKDCSHLGGGNSRDKVGIGTTKDHRSGSEGDSSLNHELDNIMTNIISRTTADPEFETLLDEVFGSPSSPTSRGDTSSQDTTALHTRPLSTPVPPCIIPPITQSPSTSTLRSPTSVLTHNSCISPEPYSSHMSPYASSQPHTLSPCYTSSVPIYEPGPSLSHEDPVAASETSGKKMQKRRSKNDPTAKTKPEITRKARARSDIFRGGTSNLRLKETSRSKSAPSISAQIKNRKKRRLKSSKNLNKDDEKNLGEQLLKEFADFQSSRSDKQGDNDGMEGAVAINKNQSEGISSISQNETNSENISHISSTFDPNKATEFPPSQLYGVSPNSNTEQITEHDISHSDVRLSKNQDEFPNLQSDGAVSHQSGVILYQNGALSHQANEFSNLQSDRAVSQQANEFSNLQSDGAVSHQSGAVSYQNGALSHQTVNEFPNLQSTGAVYQNGAISHQTNEFPLQSDGAVSYQNVAVSHPANNEFHNLQSDGAMSHQSNKYCNLQSDGAVSYQSEVENVPQNHDINKLQNLQGLHVSGEILQEVCHDSLHVEVYGEDPQNCQGSYEESGGGLLAPAPNISIKSLSIPGLGPSLPVSQSPPKNQVNISSLVTSFPVTQSPLKNKVTNPGLVPSLPVTQSQIKNQLTIPGLVPSLPVTQSQIKNQVTIPGLVPSLPVTQSQIKNQVTIPGLVPSLPVTQSPLKNQDPYTLTELKPMNPYTAPYIEGSYMVEEGTGILYPERDSTYNNSGITQTSSSPTRDVAPQSTTQVNSKNPTNIIIPPDLKEQVITLCDGTDERPAATMMIVQVPDGVTSIPLPMAPPSVIPSRSARGRKKYARKRGNPTIAPKESSSSTQPSVSNTASKLDIENCITYTLKNDVTFSLPNIVSDLETTNKEKKSVNSAWKNTTSRNRKKKETPVKASQTKTEKRSSIKLKKGVKRLQNKKKTGALDNSIIETALSFALNSVSPEKNDSGLLSGDSFNVESSMMDLDNLLLDENVQSESLENASDNLLHETHSETSAAMLNNYLLEENTEISSQVTTHNNTIEEVNDQDTAKSVNIEQDKESPENLKKFNDAVSKYNIGRSPQLKALLHLSWSVSPSKKKTVNIADQSPSVNVIRKRGTQSTPSRKSHIRALDFGTPRKRARTPKGRAVTSLKFSPPFSKKTKKLPSATKKKLMKRILEEDENVEETGSKDMEGCVKKRKNVNVKHPHMVKTGGEEKQATPLEDNEDNEDSFILRFDDSDNETAENIDKDKEGTNAKSNGNSNQKTVKPPEKNESLMATKANELETPCKNLTQLVSLCLEPPTPVLPSEQKATDQYPQGDLNTPIIPMHPKTPFKSPYLKDYPQGPYSNSSVSTSYYIPSEGSLTDSDSLSPTRLEAAWDATLRKELGINYSPVPVKSPKSSNKKTPAKSSSKTPAKSSSKTPAKSSSKTPAKSSSKTPAKNSSKSPAKSPSKSTTKSPSKMSMKMMGKIIEQEMDKLFPGMEKSPEQNSPMKNSKSVPSPKSKPEHSADDSFEVQERSKTEKRKRVPSKKYQGELISEELDRLFSRTQKSAERNSPIKTSKSAPSPSSKSKSESTERNSPTETSKSTPSPSSKSKPESTERNKNSSMETSKNTPSLVSKSKPEHPGKSKTEKKIPLKKKQQLNESKENDDKKKSKSKKQKSPNSAPITKKNTKKAKTLPQEDKTEISLSNASIADILKLVNAKKGKRENQTPTKTKETSSESDSEMSPDTYSKNKNLLSKLGVTLYKLLDNPTGSECSNKVTQQGGQTAGPSKPDTAKKKKRKSQTPTKTKKKPGESKVSPATSGGTSPKLLSHPPVSEYSKVVMQQGDQTFKPSKSVTAKKRKEKSKNQPSQSGVASSTLLDHSPVSEHSKEVTLQGDQTAEPTKPVTAKKGKGKIQTPTETKKTIGDSKTSPGESAESKNEPSKSDVSSSKILDHHPVSEHGNEMMQQGDQAAVPSTRPPQETQELNECSEYNLQSNLLVSHKSNDEILQTSMPHVHNISYDRVETEKENTEAQNLKLPVTSLSNPTLDKQCNKDKLEAISEKPMISQASKERVNDMEVMDITKEKGNEESIDENQNKSAENIQKDKSENSQVLKGNDSKNCESNLENLILEEATNEDHVNDKIVDKNLARDLSIIEPKIYGIVTRSRRARGNSRSCQTFLQISPFKRKKKKTAFVDIKEITIEAIVSKEIVTNISPIEDGNALSSIEDIVKDSETFENVENTSPVEDSDLVSFIDDIVSKETVTNTSPLEESNPVSSMIEDIVKETFENKFPMEESNPTVSKETVTNKSPDSNSDSSIEDIVKEMVENISPQDSNSYTGSFFEDIVKETVTNIPSIENAKDINPVSSIEDIVRIRQEIFRNKSPVDKKLVDSSSEVSSSRSTDKVRGGKSRGSSKTRGAGGKTRRVSKSRTVEGKTSIGVQTSCVRGKTRCVRGKTRGAGESSNVENLISNYLCPMDTVPLINLVKQKVTAEVHASPESPTNTIGTSTSDTSEKKQQSEIDKTCTDISEKKQQNEISPQSRIIQSPFASWGVGLKKTKPISIPRKLNELESPSVHKKNTESDLSFIDIEDEERQEPLLPSSSAHLKSHQPTSISLHKIFSSVGCARTTDFGNIRSQKPHKHYISCVDFGEVYNITPKTSRRRRTLDSISDMQNDVSTPTSTDNEQPMRRGTVRAEHHTQSNSQTSQLSDKSRVQEVPDTEPRSLSDSKANDKTEESVARLHIPARGDKGQNASMSLCQQPSYPPNLQIKNQLEIKSTTAVFEGETITLCGKDNEEMSVSVSPLVVSSLVSLTNFQQIEEQMDLIEQVYDATSSVNETNMEIMQKSNDSSISKSKDSDICNSKEKHISNSKGSLISSKDNSISNFKDSHVSSKHISNSGLVSKSQEPDIVLLDVQVTKERSGNDQNIELENTDKETVTSAQSSTASSPKSVESTGDLWDSSEEHCLLSYKSLPSTPEKKMNQICHSIVKKRKAMVAFPSPSKIPNPISSGFSPSKNNKERPGVESSTTHSVVEQGNSSFDLNPKSRIISSMEASDKENSPQENNSSIQCHKEKNSSKRMRFAKMTSEHSTQENIDLENLSTNLNSKNDEMGNEYGSDNQTTEYSDGRKENNETGNNQSTIEYNVRRKENNERENDKSEYRRNNEEYDETEYSTESIYKSTDCVKRSDENNDKGQNNSIDNSTEKLLSPSESHIENESIVAEEPISEAVNTITTYREEQTQSDDSDAKSRDEEDDSDRLRIEELSETDLEENEEAINQVNISLSEFFDIFSMNLKKPRAKRNKKGASEILPAKEKIPGRPVKKNVSKARPAKKQVTKAKKTNEKTDISKTSPVKKLAGKKQVTKVKKTDDKSKAGDMEIGSKEICSRTKDKPGDCSNIIEELNPSKILKRPRIISSKHEVDVHVGVKNKTPQKKRRRITPVRIGDITWRSEEEFSRWSWEGAKISRKSSQEKQDVKISRKSSTGSQENQHDSCEPIMHRKDPLFLGQGGVSERSVSSLSSISPGRLLISDSPCAPDISPTHYVSSYSTKDLDPSTNPSNIIDPKSPQVDKPSQLVTSNARSQSEYEFHSTGTSLNKSNVHSDIGGLDSSNSDPSQGISQSYIIESETSQEINEDIGIGRQRKVRHMAGELHSGGSLEIACNPSKPLAIMSKHASEDNMKSYLSMNEDSTMSRMPPTPGKHLFVPPAPAPATSIPSCSFSNNTMIPLKKRHKTIAIPTPVKKLHLSQKKVQKFTKKHDIQKFLEKIHKKKELRMDA